MEIPIIIDLKNVTISNEEKVVLENIDFVLAAGEMSYIIGKSGSGKSSLMRALYGANELDQGQARVGDYDLNSLSRKNIPELRRSMGMVFQDFNLFTESYRLEGCDGDH